MEIAFLTNFLRRTIQSLSPLRFFTLLRPVSAKNRVIILHFRNRVEWIKLVFLISLPGHNEMFYLPLSSQVYVRTLLWWTVRTHIEHRFCDVFVLLAFRGCNAPSSSHLAETLSTPAPVSSSCSSLLAQRNWK